MNPFEMVVLIVAIVTIGKVLSARFGGAGFGSRNGRKGRNDRVLVQENDRLRDEIAQLKDRVVTLERIAVDKRSRLADEIDALGGR